MEVAEQGAEVTDTRPAGSSDVDADTSAVAGNFDVQGHRGARGLKPENTLPAFETALDLGVDTLELDLHFSADGELVIWHDDTIDPAKCRLDPEVDSPTAPDPDPEGRETTLPIEALRISELTLSQLRQYRCDRNPDPEQFPEQDNQATELAGDTYTILTLEELFDFVEQYATAPAKDETQQLAARRAHFNVETKRNPGKSWAIGDDFDGESPGAFEEALVNLIEARDLIDRVVIQSFDFRSIWAVRQLNPDITLAALTSRPVDLESLSENGAEILSPRSTLMRPSLVQNAHELGMRIIPWTVNQPDEMRRLIEMGADGIISDRPDLLLEEVQSD